MPRPDKPLVAITADVVEGRFRVSRLYAEAVARAGGIPIVVGPIGAPHSHSRDCVALANAFILTGGSDPAMEPFGKTTHPAANPMNEHRQAFETELLRVLRDERPGMPVLGVCLGMQLMALIAGGDLHQHLPDVLADAERHTGDRQHPISVEEPHHTLAAGVVASDHHQAVSRAGSLAVVGRSDDGVIEAIADPDRPFYLGVQWHPERTADPALGQRLFEHLISAAREGQATVA